jgi:hypothetical protein
VIKRSRWYSFERMANEKFFVKQDTIKDTIIKILVSLQHIYDNITEKPRVLKLSQ